MIHGPSRFVAKRALPPARPKRPMTVLEALDEFYREYPGVMDELARK